MKKLIASLIALSISLALSILFSSSVSAQEIITEIVDTHKFSDVDSNDIEVLYLNQIDVVRGNPDGTVLSENPLNRAETLTLLSRFFNLTPEYDPSCTFSDVPSDAWYAGYVSAMCNEGLVRGYDDGTFRASNQLNRSEALALVARGSESIFSPPFTHLPPDVNGDEWFAPYADFAAEHNLFTGVNSQFNGARLYTRGDMFEVLYRYARIQELEVDVYSSSLDPQIVSATANKNSNVTFRVIEDDSDVSAYFNSFFQGIQNNPPEPVETTVVPQTYMQTAYDLAVHYGVALTSGQIDIDFLAKIVGPIRRIAFMNDVDFTREVRAFYEYFGVNMDGKDINDDITDAELTAVINDIEEKSNLYNRVVDDLKISFLVDNPRKISIIFADKAIEQYNWTAWPENSDLWDPEYENSLIRLEYENSLSWRPLELESLMEQDNGTEVPITKIIFDTTYIKGVDANGMEIIESIHSSADIELGADLEDGKTYLLKLKPLLFGKLVHGNFNIDRFMSQSLYYTNVYLPASEFEFVNNSAKEFNYTGSGNQNLAGVAIENDILTGWNDLGLSALAYSEDGRTLDVEPGQLQWSIASGPGDIITGTYGMPELRFDSIDSQVTVMVQYQGFEDTRTIYYRSGMSGP